MGPVFDFHLLSYEPCNLEQIHSFDNYSLSTYYVLRIKSLFPRILHSSRKRQIINE